MGIGNLESVLAAYGEDDASWARVYFDVTPRSHPGALPAAVGLRRRLRHLPVARLRGARDDAALPGGPASSCAASRGSKPRRPRPRRSSIRAPRRRCSGRRTSSRRPTDRASCGRSPRFAGCASTRAWASSPGRPAPTAPSTAVCGPRPTRWPSTWPRACARSSGTRASLIVSSMVRDERYQRRARGAQRVRHRALLAPHDRLRPRHPAPLREPRPGRGVPVPARPAAVARPDRLDPRAGGDPHHRLQRGGQAGSVDGVEAAATPPSRARERSAASGVSAAYWRISRSERRNRCSSAIR